MKTLRIHEEASKVTSALDDYRFLIVCRMTIGWIEEWVNNGEVRDGLEFKSSD